MSFDESTIGRELRHSLAAVAAAALVRGIHDRRGLGMRQKKNLLSAHPERVFDPRHQRQRRFTLTALKVCDVTGLDPSCSANARCVSPSSRRFCLISRPRPFV